MEILEKSFSNRDRGAFSSSRSWVLALLIGLGMIPFASTLQTPFLYDDAHAVVENRFTQDLAPYPEAFGLENLFNRPVLMFTFALNRTLGGLDVFGFHLVNLTLHVVTGLTLYCLAGELLALIPAARRERFQGFPFLAAAIHLVHPLAMEPVAYLSGRSSLLATWFYLLGMLFLVRFFRKEDPAQGGPMGCLVLALGFFILGCGTKAIILTLPVMGVVYLRLRFPQDFWTRLGPVAGLILVPLAIYLMLRTSQLGGAFTLPDDPDPVPLNRWLYFLTQVKALVFYYLLKFLFPINQNFEPDIRLVTGAGEWEVLAAAAVLLGLALWVKAQRSPVLTFAALWIVVTLAPTSSLVPLKQIVSEHRFYLPGIGACLAAAWVLCSLRLYARIRLPGALMILVACLLLTSARGADFRSEIALWADTAAKSPRKPLVHNNLAMAYLGAGRRVDAERELQTTLRLDPAHASARINLGYLYAKHGDTRKALDQFTAAIERGSMNPVVFHNAGLALMQLDRPEQAVLYLDKAVHLRPDAIEYRFHLGQAYQKLKRLDEALLEYRRVLRQNPAHFLAHLNRGTIFWDQKNFYFADSAFQQAYQLNPKSPLVLSNLASSNLLFHNYAQAIRYLEEWLRVEPDNVTARQLLTAAVRLRDAAAP